MTLNSASTSRLRPSASEVPITSRWCNRALRPLTSTILRLEKHWKITPLSVPQGTINGSNALDTLRLEAAGAPSDARESSESESTPDDPTWVPGGGGGAGRRKIKHRYSGGNRSRVVVRSPEAQKLAPGEFSIPTPLIKGRVRGRRGSEGEDVGSIMGPPDEDNVSAVQNSQNWTNTTTKRKTLNNQVAWRDWGDEYNDPSYINIVQGIFGIWDSFLTMTAPRQHSNRGARSLMSMALDKTSMYIMREQEAADNAEEKDEKVDAADVIITELEDMYGLSNNGWKPLKSLVRLHGIRLVCEAIRKRWISPKVARQLALNAIDSSSYDATREVLSALLSVTQRIDGPWHIDCTLFSLANFGIFNTLATYVNKSGNLSFFFREVGPLLQRGIVAVEWIATESMKPFVTHAIQSISCDDEDCAASVLFVANTMLAASGSSATFNTTSLGQSATQVMDKIVVIGPTRSPRRRISRNTSSNPPAKISEYVSIALNNSISSIISILCSAHIVRFGKQRPYTSSPASSMQHILTRLSAIVQHDLELAVFDLTTNRSRSELLRIGYILMADYLLGCCCKETRKNYAAMARLLANFEYFIRPLKNRNDLTSGLSALVTNVSHRCGRAREEDAFLQLRFFSKALTADHLQRYPTLRALLGKVAVDMALDFAEETLHPDHHSWASDIQTKVSSYEPIPLDTDGMLMLTPSLALSKTGYVWEDGIGEWVAAAKVPTKPPYTRRRTMPNLPKAIEQDDSGSSSRSSTPSSDLSNNDGSSSITSDSSSPLCVRKRKEYPASFGAKSSKRARTISPAILTANSRQLRSRKSEPWDLYVDEFEDGESDSDVSMPDRMATSSVKPYAQEPALPRKPVLGEGKGINYSRSTSVAVPIKPPHEPQGVGVEVVIVNNNKLKDVTNTKRISSRFRDKNHYEKASNEAYISDSNSNDKTDDDDDILTNEPPPRFFDLRRRSIGISTSTPATASKKTNSRPSSPMAMITRLRSTRSSSLRNQAAVRAVVPDSEGSSDDELSFL
ncbi:hypothetical protein FQN53_009302 [Emmonsiellopsis sp. PD_33]|nr:hypothetical protein FQN53_009302 [Emmonsiellopsis sp. PD_33]KAK2806073.1 hypothetical protein FQN51_008026 [Onygenales sp. PD_10]